MSEIHSSIPPRKPVVIWRLLALSAIVGGMVVLAVWSLALELALARLRQQAETEVATADATMRAELSRYKVLPKVLSTHSLVHAVLRDPRPSQVEALNHLFERLTAISGALDIYLMDMTGLTLAHSGAHGPTPFIGRNFIWRPYFQEAAEGRMGRYYGVGVTSNQRGIYFAVPVAEDDERIGVLAIKLDVARIEEAWGHSESTLLAADPDQVIFLSNRPPLRLSVLEPLSSEARQRLSESRRYHVSTFPALPPFDQRRHGDQALLGHRGLIWQELGFRGDESLAVKHHDHDLELTLWLLKPTAEARRMALQSASLAAALWLALTAILLLVWQWRMATLTRLADTARARAELEQRVIERTEALSTLNEALRRENAERQQAETALRRAQAELVQAEKLSAMGRLMAGLSHELNQPLAAIGNFADNAVLLLARGRLPEVEANLQKIAALTQRVARIIRNLRTFARREDVPVQDVDLLLAIQEALQLMEGRLAKVHLDWQPPSGPVMVRGGLVRLQQVLVNLLTNALDAMADQAEPRLTMTVEQGPQVVLTLRDFGHGLGPDRGQLFEPFYSTKPQGEGLGLGLSISWGIIESFGGTITLENAEGGGARAIVRLLPAQEVKEAAE